MLTTHELGQVLSEWLEAQPLVRQVHSAPAPDGGKVGLLTVILEEPAAAPHFFDALNVAKASPFKTWPIYFRPWQKAAASFGPESCQPGI